MNHVAFVPIKNRSTRVKGKNFRLVRGKPLYHYIFETLKETHFDAIYVDTDSEVVADDALALGFEVINRLPELATDTANGNELLAYHHELIDADVYYQTFATAPLLRAETINDCISIMDEGHHDSCFTALKKYEWTWFNGSPVNYNPDNLPRSQDATPVIFETTGLYGVHRSVLDKKIRRIGHAPYMKFVNEDEAVDLDNEFDFFVLENIIERKENG